MGSAADHDELDSIALLDREVRWLEPITFRVTDHVHSLRRSGNWSHRGSATSSAGVPDAGQPAMPAIPEAGKVAEDGATSDPRAASNGTPPVRVINEYADLLD